MRRASIDVGTNSMLLLIVEKDQDQWKVLKDMARIVRPGEGMNQKGASPRFKKEALNRIEETLVDFKNEIQKYDVKTYQALATAAARKAENQDEFKEIFKKKEIPIKIIEGKEEAWLTYLGANFELNLTNYSVLDIGGGSTEILWSESSGLEGKSLDMGAVQITEQFFPNKDFYSEEEINEAIKYIQNELKKLSKWEENLTMVAVAGTPTTIVSCEKGLKGFIREEIHKEKLHQKTIKKWLDVFNTEYEKRVEIKGLDKERADIIFAGTLILRECLRHFSCNECIVSVGGLRYGAILDEK